MHVYPFNGHEHGDATQVRRQLRWLADVLGGPAALAAGPAVAMPVDVALPH